MRQIQPAGLLVDARLAEPPAERMIRLADAPGLARELGMFHEFLKVDLAHTAMLVERRILSRADGRKILRVLRQIDSMGPSGFPVDPGKGSFLLQVEDYLFKKIGEEIGGRMHTGRSRLDQGPTARRLYKRRRLIDVLRRLTALERTLIGLAARHKATVMPGYTCLQHAQPWTFGHYLHSFVDRLSDDFDRLVAAFARVDLNPLGAAGLAGTSWPLDRRRTTALLGFGGLVENARLAREAYYAADAIAALSFAMADLNDLATDLHVWSSFEFRMVECADGYCGTSSVFPQKKNPIALEVVKARAGAATTWLGSALATFRAEGSGDVTNREVPQIDSAFTATEGMLELMDGVMRTLTVHGTRMRELSGANWATASNLADAIVRRNELSYRQTHHAVGRLVRSALAAGVGPDRVTGAMLDRAAEETIGRKLGLDDAAVRAALEPETFVRTRRTTGSVNPAETARMLKTSRTRLASQERWIARMLKRQKGADAKLTAAIGRIMRG